MTSAGDSLQLYVEKLKNDPDVTTVNSAMSLFSREDLSSADLLNATLVVLDYTVPQIYGALDVECQIKIIRFLQSVRGISGLLSKIQLVSGEAVKVYVTVLSHCFNDSLLQHLNARSAFDINQVNKLLFKGQVFSVMNEVVGRDNIDPKFLSMGLYVHYLCTQLVRADIEGIEKYLVSVVSLDFMAVFDVLFTENYYQILLNVYRLVKFHQKPMAAKLLTFISNRQLAHGKEKANACAVLLRPFLVNIDASMVEKAIRLQNRQINWVLALSMEDKKPLFDTIFRSWSDASLIKSEPVIIQEYKTHLLIQFLYFLPEHQLGLLISDTSFLQGISNRLGSYSQSVKILAVVLADKVCELAGKDKIFSISDVEGFEYLSDPSLYIHELQTYSYDIAWQELNMPVVEFDEVEEVIKPVQQLDLLKTYKDSDDESSEDDSDDEDDPTIVQRSKISAPVYIKDLIKYLRMDSKHPQAYDMVRIALASGPSLIRQKSSFGHEILINSHSLLSTLIGLSDEFNLANFEDLKLNCLIAVLVSYPQAGQEICQMLGTGDFSLQQRMSILSALSLAARDIRGFKDEVVTKSYKEKAFPTKQLPTNLHQQYLALDSRLNQAHLSIQDSLILDDVENARDQLVGGKILRLSRRMQQKPSDILTPRIQDYSKVLTTNFYFPLTHLWYEAGGIDIGHYSPLLTGHYIKTLALLLHCSFSVTNNDTIREFLIIAKDVIGRTTADQIQVIEGLMTGVLLICDISDEELLVVYFGDYIMAIQAWISEIWESIIDNQIKSLCAGCLLRISLIFDKYQATLTDQINNIY